MKNIIKIILIFSVSILTSCSIFSPSKMLNTGPNYEYSTFPEKLEEEYRIAPNDNLSFKLFTNDGFKLIDLTNGMYDNKNNNNNIYNQGQNALYIIEFDGMVKFPILGRIKLAGLTVREAEKKVEELYAKYYNNPFAIITLTNQRIFIFPGTEGDAKVYTLKNDNTTLFEALAEIGGIQDGKANKIKLIRGNLQNPNVYLIDLSTIDGMKNANLVLQANDIIYIEPRNKYAQKFVSSIAPWFSLISTFLLALAYINQVK